MNSVFSGYGLTLLVAIGLFCSLNASAQTEKLGIVQYTAPPGMSKTQKDNVVAFSTFDQASGKYCIVTLYGATPGTGDAKKDFTREWTNLVVKPMGAAADPQTEASRSDGWSILAGGSAVETETGKAVAFLTVISGDGRTVSILAVFNDHSYLRQVETFIGGIDLDMSPASQTSSAPAPAQLAFDVDGHIIMPEPKARFTVAELAGKWEEGGRTSTSYVDRSTGAHAGTDSLAVRNTLTISSNGTYTNDFFAIRNGKKERDITAGTITVVGRLLSIRQSNRTVKYVIRGWLELPNMTILRLADGPWQNDDVIPENRFTDFSEFSRFYTKTHWVRMK